MLFESLSPLGLPEELNGIDTDFNTPIAIFGEVTLDRTIFLNDKLRPGDTTKIRTAYDRFGGMLYWAGQALYSMGEKPTFVGRYSGNTNPVELFGDTSRLVRSIKDKIIYVLVEPSGRRSFLSEQDEGRYVESLDLIDFPLTSVGLICGYAVLPQRWAKEAVRFTETCMTAVVVLPSSRAFNGYGKDMLSLFSQMHSSTIVAIGSDKETLLLGSDPEDSLPNLIVITTAGEGRGHITVEKRLSGNYWNELHIPVELKDFPDTTGAGDTFSAGVAAAIKAKSMPPLEFENSDWVDVINAGHMTARHHLENISLDDPPTM